MSEQPKPRTLVDIFFQVVERDLPRVMLYEQGKEWRAISSRDLYRRVMGVVQGLRRRGISHGDRVAIIAENRPEWAIADFAILLCGAVTVPIYPTLASGQIRYMLRNAGARAVFVSTAAQLAKLEFVQAELGLEAVYLMDEPPVDSGAYAMSALMESGPGERVAELDALAYSVEPSDLATIIYTSGTTGVPKGAMLTHGNIASNLSVSLWAFELFERLDLAVSFLPLSHITARHVDFAELYRGVTIAYCPVIDELPRILREVRPTFFVAVPRVYEKIYNKVLRDTATGWKHAIYRWAISVGKAHMDEVVAGQTPRSPAWKLADHLVFSRVRAGMGGRVRIFISGGAPLGKELAEWYAQIGIVIHEGYGLTETSPVIAVNTPEARKLGTVGRPLPNVELRIAEDGELLVRGPSVFQGYWTMPEETAAAFDGDWFRTGDLATIDPDGYLLITGRKKDLIKTSGGKFIAPQPIENALKANALIAEAAMLGDRRRFPAVLLMPAFNALEQWAREHGVKFQSREELVGNWRVQALYEEIVHQINQNLAHFEQLKKVLVVAEEPSIEDGTLTPTLKLRRQKLEERYRDRIDEMYATATAPAPSPADAAHSG
jgi:long-chain acyl-CoA synthetase